MVTLIKHAFRQLVPRPGLSATMIAMLALGIGAATAIFSLFYQVLVQPLPVPEPERLVNIVHSGSAPGGQSFSYAIFRDLEAGQSMFTGIAANGLFSANVAYAHTALSAPGAFVSGGYFGTLDLHPALGRLIGPQDEPRAGESAVVVLSHDFWQSRFGSDPGVVGRVLTINGQPLQVIGVAPAGFSGTQIGARIRIFVPMTMHWQLDAFGPSDTPENRRFRFVRLFARLRDGITATQAAARLNTVYARIVKAEGPQPARMQQYLSRPLELAPGARGQGAMQAASPPLSLLLAVTLLVLLIVCVNVANLLLMRGAARAGEIAIRESIGASRGRLIAELLAETAIPAAIGGILSLPIAAAALAAVAPILPASLAEGLGMHVGGAAVLFAALATAHGPASHGVEASRLDGIDRLGRRTRRGDRGRPSRRSAVVRAIGA